jgi:predicted RecB family nuclease
VKPKCPILTTGGVCFWIISRLETPLYLSASSHYNLYRPTLCERRVFLVAHGEPQPPASDFDMLLKDLGGRHEKEHLADFPLHKDLSDGNLADRAQRTKDAIAQGVPVIYQGALRAAFPGSRDIVSGSPDFMISDGESYRIRDCKLARSMGNGRHPEIDLQLQTYGWLFEKTFAKLPSALEAYLGNRTIVTTVYRGADSAVQEIARIRELSLREDEPYDPVGWTKCSACAFRERCWSIAEKEHDVSVIYRVDKGTARALRDKGITTYDQLLKRMDAKSLAKLKRPWGPRTQKVGGQAKRILAQARALAEGRVVRLGGFDLPRATSLVMFDLEGIPPQYEELDKVYLWGAQVYGAGGAIGAYKPAVAGFGAEGDRAGWEGFLVNAREIMKEHGEVPFVHWHDYEKNKLKEYIARYGDTGGTAARVLDACFDLLPVVRDSLALPVPSYSLKTIEGLAGFKRTMKEYGGDWSIGRYIRAVENDDEAERRAIMDEILRYNEEDLKATWTVFRWVKGLLSQGLLDFDS